VLWPKNLSSWCLVSVLTVLVMSVKKINVFQLRPPGSSLDWSGMLDEHFLAYGWWL
jgi:hypothetical protein